MIKNTKLHIKNTNKVIGLSMLGLSISDWLEFNDRYDFLVHDSAGVKWMLTLNRIADADGKYVLSLYNTGDIFKVKIEAGEIKIKRLFYKSILSLTEKVRENVLNKIN